MDSVPALNVAEASAPGKVILCGEHSVVYGYPAIAVPVSALRAYARVVPAGRGKGFQVCAEDLGCTIGLAQAAAHDPIAAVPRAILRRYQLPEPDGTLTVHSELPMAAGLGSGAAVAVAMARALLLALGLPAPADEVSAIAFEAEKLHHGTPSGIDNTVIAWEQPIVFVRGEAPQRLHVGAELHLLIANSGIASSTREMVAGVRARYEAEPERYARLLAALGEIAGQARDALTTGDVALVGDLFNRNQRLLEALGVSHPRLEALIAAARQAGAWGAKLTGAGGGGNLIALVSPERSEMVRAALLSAGARQVWYTRLSPTPREA